MKKFTYTVAAAALMLTASCSKDFLEKVPQGQLSSTQTLSQDAVNSLLVGAYGLMNGNINGTWGNYASAPSQWLFGEVAADNAHKGSTSTDQPFMNQVESHQPTADNDNLQIMWRNYFEGILRCNNTLRTLAALQSSGNNAFSQDAATQIQAETRMLRAHYYFFLHRIFINVPLIDENTTTAQAAVLSNTTDVLPSIKADLDFAVANLPATSTAGRMNKVIAQAYLGKYLLYQKQYAPALAQFTAVISARGLLTGMPFQNNFDVTTKNGPESIMASQSVINPDGSGDNANVGDMLSGLYGTSPVGCCGFYQPTIDLVNAYKVDANGLPLLDGSYRTNPYRGSGSTATIAFDPRLDYTVGRQGVSYLDYGIMPGNDWVRDAAYAGPFVGIKTMVPKSQFAANTVSGAAYITALNVNIIRLADVVLMAAECNAELGNLPEATRLVNLVRARAATLPAKVNAAGQPAAIYRVGQYPTFASQDYARNAIRFERRLELAMEGHRFFDLVRWGVAKQVIESYSGFEGGILSAYRGIQFETRDTYFPIPQDQIDKSQGNLKQNPSY
ncbi:MAG: RagB/SusD family nutrient uptake outer membrane protein [Mucilaginibacter polytrichastri]|nr:RagB/SusD family nutrient uptake outer membrane protein [Mucilaginibacter polytrichastri]